MIALRDYCDEVVEHYKLCYFLLEVQPDTPTTEYHCRLVARSLYYLAFHAARERAIQAGVLEFRNKKLNHAQVWNWFDSPEGRVVSNASRIAQYGRDLKLEREKACYDLNDQFRWASFLGGATSKAETILFEVDRGLYDTLKGGTDVAQDWAKKEAKEWRESLQKEPGT